ncbi:MAG: hypothetical protein APG08_00655 [Candidatus Methanofastidiosum methylothiophilum]|jgi:hypothetical protein|uniref:Rab5-interacting protein (Rab5ip) n=1 Tax=Candidatus Methanofastidiosum methylothiophilum TaxID=1705564 RepID=A0A150JNC2_9EURY|nr:MAG: hypothetical protein AN188_00715 [Candidatus Methanofastidiosum methylthiophilus]OQC50357.1 MAG: hypothetical protein BWX56_01356 [Euryarchaeota archaeon ADurb.Bin023]HNW32919.1 hypothetical protein [Candidatus Dojkabacteria bacterium]HNZ59830.1 hypothetical protein [Methanofastidiosum sp.]KYC56890.1 MAG: hypothetical protein APG08_00655 [Candidatus Methanofastidiosum methylthiophilus]
MDDDHKVGLVFALTGLIAGVISGILPIPKVATIILAFVIFYASQYFVKMIGVDKVKYGNTSSILKSGIFSFLGSWLMFWIIIFNS